jgi:hypothetical protein
MPSPGLSKARNWPVHPQDDGLQDGARRSAGGGDFMNIFNEPAYPLSAEQPEMRRFEKAGEQRTCVYSLCDTYRFSCAAPSLPILLRRKNPKISRIDDAEVAGVGIAIKLPVFRHFGPQDVEQLMGEVFEGGGAFIVGDSFVHDAPQSPDRAGTRTVSRDEVKFDPALRPIEPFLNHFSMMVSGVAGKHVNPPFERIQDLEGHRQRHRAPRVDRQNFDHFCFTGFSIDSAGDIKAIPPAAFSWRRENYPGCAEKRVDTWPIDLLRPRVFLDRVFQKSAGSNTQ